MTWTVHQLLVIVIQDISARPLHCCFTKQQFTVVSQCCCKGFALLNTARYSSNARVTFECIWNAPCTRPACILDTFHMHSECVLPLEKRVSWCNFIMRFCTCLSFILDASYMHSGLILHTFWAHVNVNLDLNCTIMYHICSLLDFNHQLSDFILAANSVTKSLSCQLT